jgi:predicted transcriptional regulator
MLFDRRKDPIQVAASRRVKAWAEALADLAEGDTVMVTELQCTEPGCPPVETVIAILRANAGPVQRKVHKPVREITEADVREVMGGGKPHPHPGA